MKSLRTFLFATCILVCTAILASAQDMDTQLSSMTKDLAVKIQANGCKKVAVLDFTDLQGNSSELGRYVAEQLTVDLVMDKDNFAVMDRANLKSILDEHKLTATGLVDPENAKQLGKFAGVDALIVGNIASIGSNISIAVKVITTETAEVVTAAKTKFASDDTLQQLLSQTVANDASSSPKAETPPGSPSQQFSNLLVTVENVVVVNNSEVALKLAFKNTSRRNSIGVGMFSQPIVTPEFYQLSSKLVAADGSELTCDNHHVNGIGAIRDNPDFLTVLEPGKTTKATLRYIHMGFIQPDLSRIKSFTLLADVLLNANYHSTDYDNYQPRYNEAPPHCKIEKLSLDLKTQ